MSKTTTTHDSTRGGFGGAPVQIGPAQGVAGDTPPPHEPIALDGASCETRNPEPPNPKQPAGPTLRYVIPRRGDVEKENALAKPSPKKTKPPTKPKRKRNELDPKQGTLSQVFREGGVVGDDDTEGIADCINDTGGIEGINDTVTDTPSGAFLLSNPETIDDETLVDANARLFKKTKSKGNDSTRTKIDCSTPQNLAAFAKAFSGAAAVGVGVLLRDAVGNRKFGWRSNLRPAVSAEEEKAARKAAKALGGPSASPPEGGWASDVCQIPVALGVVLLGSAPEGQSIDAGDGRGSAVYVFPVVSATGGASDKFTFAGGQGTTRALQETLASSGIPIVTHHAQMVVRWLCQLDVRVDISTTTFLDSRTIAWLAAPDDSHELGVEKVDALFPNTGTGNQSQKPPTDPFAVFRRDLHLCANLVRRFRRLDAASNKHADSARKQKIASTALRECRAGAILGTLESTGMPFDVVYAKRVVTHFRNECVSLSKIARQLVKTPFGDDVNLAAPAQVAEALYVTLNLPPPAVFGSDMFGSNRGPPPGTTDNSTTNQSYQSNKSATSTRTVALPQFRSTKDEVLRALASAPNAHPFPAVVLKFRAALKAASTCASYVSQFEKKKSGRLHCEWNNTRTATGRLSSSNPNLQAVASVVVSSSESSNSRLSLRGAFRAPPGKVLLAADYSQIELRILAHLAGDTRLEQIMNPLGTDAGDVNDDRRPNDAFERIWNCGLGVSESSPVSSSDRAKAKTTVYGLLYGQGTTGLAAKLNIQKVEAIKLTEALLRAFPKLKQFTTATKTLAKQNGKVTIPTSARVRVLPGFTSHDSSIRAEAERKAVNTLVQGTAADLIKLAMERWVRVCSVGRARDSQSHQNHQNLLAEISRRGVPEAFALSKHCRLIAQIHDELLFEIENDPESIKHYANAVRVCMEGAAAEFGMAFATPTKVSVGKDWASLRPLS